MSKRSRDERRLARAGLHHQQQSPTTVTVHAQHQQLRIAPLPHPDELVAYDNALPGLAERIVRMAELNGDDRRRNNRTMRWVTVLSQLFAFTLMGSGLAGGYYLVYLDKDAHPGEIFKLEFREPADPPVSQAEAARRVGWSTNRMNEFELGKRGVTPENAVMLAALTGTSAEFWMQLQANYDLWHAMKKLGQLQIDPIGAGAPERP